MIRDIQLMDDLISQLQQKSISFRPDGKYYIATITDTNSNNYSLAGNVSVFFCKPSMCIYL